ncbi:MAG: hypothetical protein ACK49M_04925 [Actinomycetes bacterium]
MRSAIPVARLVSSGEASFTTTDEGTRGSALRAANRRFMPTWPEPIRTGSPTVTSVPKTSLKKAESMFPAVYSLFPTQVTVAARPPGSSVVAC